MFQLENPSSSKFKSSVGRSAPPLRRVHRLVPKLEIEARVSTLEAAIALPLPSSSLPLASEDETRRLARIIARQEYRLLHLSQAYDVAIARALAAERALAAATNK